MDVDLGFNDFLGVASNNDGAAPAPQAQDSFPMYGKNVPFADDSQRRAHPPAPQ
jgi:hypothetical protein